jgi:hypothetical protein
MEERDPISSRLRLLFVVGAIAIFLAVPLAHALPAPLLTFVVAAALLTTFFAGLTNPTQYWVAMSDMIIASVACVFFELAAISAYGSSGMDNPAFFVLQLLAVNFLVAFYFAVKTFRGMYIIDESPEPPPAQQHESHFKTPSLTDDTLYK